MGVALYGDVHQIAITTGGKQTLTVNAGKAHANSLYWIFGSGTRRGVNLLGVHIPLNPDPYTDVPMANVNTFRRPPQRSHNNTSMPNTRRINCAQWPAPGRA
jgi:hypothetical protein